ncbi:MAG: protein kinase [Acidobacteria bacterium]|nr:protein kinase [Acidobacteriota bacterium]
MPTMVQCPKCSAKNLPESRFCSSCAQPLGTHSQMPTATGAVSEPGKPPAESPHVARIVSSDSVPAGGFTPGMILADRYRIIGLLGRGGMGEVYRADDLKLGQPVALKFLPPKLAQDAVRRERFFAEVRITRQLSHPNICRVYDISEIDGRHFLSMEFIDGEDLASLLKRIGHLSNEKALDIARQLAAGLAAAHERGVLHRDLKPANIMIDGHGRVRITDFGLAIAIEDESQAVEIAGTPAYMAPEQLAGKGSTVRSDIYSLGLVLYEIYTGKKAFTAATLAELRQQKETYAPRAPSELREGVDPVVERLIRRCMERDPNARPSSIAQLALALPGGDPLAAAIAAGETPSPEMVAESGGKEGLHPAIAWSLLIWIILAMTAVMAINDRIMLHRRIPFNKPPEVLIERAREIIQKTGSAEKYADSAHGFILNSNLSRSIEKSGNTADRWNTLDSNALLFWYRQSPYPLNGSLLNLGSGLRVASFDHFPMQYSGDVLIILNTEGRLVSLRVIPPQGTELSGGTALEPDWKILFADAGLDPAQWMPVRPQENPKFYADNRAAWQSTNPMWADTRIETSAYQGKPVGFELHGPAGWTSRNEPASVRETAALVLLLLMVLVVVGIFFARRNLRLGRGDRRSATRLAVFVGILFMLLGILVGHHRLGFHEVIMVFEFASVCVALGISSWILYTALEPFVRRRWPQMLVSWTRLISGDWNDPLIARDILIGAASGLLVLVTDLSGTHLIPSWLGYPQPLPEMYYSGLLGMRFALFYFLIALALGVLFAVMDASVLFFLRVLLRSQIVAVIIYIVFWSYFFNTTPWSFATYVVINAIFVFILMRFGLIAFACALGLWTFCSGFPLTLDASAWYSGYGYAILAMLAAIIFFAFRKSLGGRPLFASSRLDD